MMRRSGLSKRRLSALDCEFSDCAVSVDRSVGNAGRIVRLYGTLAQKGDDVTDRPHRRSAVVRIPSAIVPVGRAQLDALAATLPTLQHAGATPASAFDLRDFMARHGIAVTREGAWLVRASNTCCALVRSTQRIQGRARSSCSLRAARLRSGVLHNSLGGREWRDVRALFESRGTSPQRSAKAIVRVAEDDESESGFVLAYDLASKADEARPWLLENRIPRGGTAVIAGKPKAGKTYVCSLHRSSRFTR